MVTGAHRSPSSALRSARSDAEKHFRDRAEWLRGRPGWTNDIANFLHMLCAEQAPAPRNSLKPVLPLRLAGGQVVLGWKWLDARGTAKALRIEKDSGNGFGFLTIDTQPGYTDKTPWPATPQKWKYRAIFVLDEENIGQWSEVAEITVGA